MTNLLVSCFKIRITCRRRYWQVSCTASHSPGGNSLVHFLAGSAHLPRFWVDPGPSLLPQPSPCFPRFQPCQVIPPLDARSLSGPPLLPSWKHLKTINKLFSPHFPWKESKNGQMVHVIYRKGTRHSGEMRSRLWRGSVKRTEGQCHLSLQPCFSNFPLSGSLLCPLKT